MIFNKLDKRQKIVLALLGLVLIFLIWQSYGLFKSPEPASPAAPQNFAAPTTATPAAARDVASAAMSVHTAPSGAAAIDPTSNSQAEYLRLVNEYQMAQLQRMIAEDNEAIAVARRNAAKALAETTGGGGSVSVSSASTTTQAPASEYALIYTGQQSDGQWAATLKKNGQSYDVVPGRQLPDGFQVTSIDENGVLLAGSSGKMLVTFSGQTQIKTDPAAKAELSTPEIAAKPSAPIVKAEPIKPVVAAPVSVETKPTMAVKAKQPAPVEVKVAKAQKPEAVKPLSAASSKSIAAQASNPVTIDEIVLQQDSLKSAQLLPLKPKKIAAEKAVASDKILEQLPAKQSQQMGSAEQQLLEVNPQYYTIQLATDNARVSAEDFIKTNKLQNEARYFRAVNESGGERFVLIYGQYASRAEAETALQKLPENIKNDNAFLVPYADIHSMLKQAALAAK